MQREREREAGQLEWREAGKRNRGQRDDRRRGHVGHGESWKDLGSASA